MKVFVRSSKIVGLLNRVKFSSKDDGSADLPAKRA